jgi:Zn-dependent protease
MVSAGLLRILRPVLAHPGVLAQAGGAFLQSMISVNIILGLFNLLPIPPLDGSRLLPRSMDGFVASAQRYSMLLMMVVIGTPLGTPLFLLADALTNALTG